MSVERERRTRRACVWACACVRLRSRVSLLATQTHARRLLRVCVCVSPWAGVLSCVLCVVCGEDGRVLACVLAAVGRVGAVSGLQLPRA